MGYNVIAESLDVLVPSKNTAAAAHMMSAMGLGEHRHPDASSVDVLADMLADHGFEVWEQADGVRIEGFNGSTHQEGLVLVALAPFVAEGSFIEWRGERDERWRTVVRDGAVVDQSFVSVVWADSATTSPQLFLRNRQPLTKGECCAECALPTG